MQEITEIDNLQHTKKRLYDYQIADLNRIFDVLETAPKDYNLLISVTNWWRKNRYIF